MSRISKLNIEEKLPIIKKLINNDEPDIKPNIITVYSLIKCFDISYLESVILLNQYVLNESDLSNYAIFFLCETIDDTGTIYSKKIVSSCDPDINKILEDENHTLSYGVFAICNLNEYYLMENYKPFIGENDLITRFDFSSVPKNSFMSLNEKKEEKINNDNNKKEKSITKKEKVVKKENIISEKEEENYYRGFQPTKKAKTDKDKINLEKKDNKRKRRDSEEDIKSEKDQKEKHKKRNTFKEDEKKSNIKNGINLSEIKEENKDEDIQMKDYTEESKELREPKKVKKIRKVKATRTYTNNEGYLVTKEEEIEEEYWSDEKPEKKVVRNFINQESKPNKNKKKANKGQTTINSFFK